jgi:CDP-4-dehydro-6-deoxyglucose reductase/ferredoxin-NAD(P)+ reductase (naphthalene dioxygenase ferredoxin-specific)
LEAGEVELAAYSSYALSDAERADGLILACRAVPWSDATVSWLEADDVVVHPQRRLTCRVIGLDQATHDITRVRLDVESGGPFTFSAGQYAALHFAGMPPRDYSMANHPNEPSLEFHIRRLGERSTSAYVADKLKLGDKVIVEGPYGSSWLREKHTGPIIAVAGGSGLAPIKSIVESALGAGMRQPIHLYFGARDERDIYLEDHFQILAARHRNLRYTAVLSQPRRATSRRVGLVHDAVASDLADLDGAKAYLAGPPMMVEAATGLFVSERGMRREDIHADAFYTEADKLALKVATPMAAAGAL